MHSGLIASVAKSLGVTMEEENAEKVVRAIEDTLAEVMKPKPKPIEILAKEVEKRKNGNATD